MFLALCGVRTGGVCVCVCVRACMHACACVGIPHVHAHVCMCRCMQESSSALKPELNGNFISLEDSSHPVSIQ
jgi:hypothetical protein